MSAAVLAPTAAICIWVGGLAFALLIVAAAIGLALEWIALLRQSGPPAGRTVRAEPSQCPETSLQSVTAPTGPVSRDWTDTGSHAAAKPNALLAAGGFLYILLSAAALLWLRTDPVAGRANLLLLLLVVWATDIGAYLVGRAVGGRRLAPRISPGKTVSGAVGGLVAALCVGFLGSLLLGDPVGGLIPDLARAGAVAACLSVVGQAGDLLESGMKRRFGVKDSGHLIPGHGGLFDRLDALLAAAPVAALLALLAGRGVILWK